MDPCPRYYSSPYFTRTAQAWGGEGPPPPGRRHGAMALEAAAAEAQVEAQVEEHQLGTHPTGQGDTAAAAAAPPTWPRLLRVATPGGHFGGAEWNSSTAVRGFLEAVAAGGPDNGRPAGRTSGAGSGDARGSGIRQEQISPLREPSRAGARAGARPSTIIWIQGSVQISAPAAGTPAPS